MLRQLNGRPIILVILLFQLLVEQLQPALGRAGRGFAFLLLLLGVAQTTQLKKAAPSLSTITKSTRKCKEE